MLNRILLILFSTVCFAEILPEKAALYYSSRTPRSEIKMLEDYEWSLELTHPAYTFDLDYERELEKYFIEYKITGVWKPAKYLGVSGKAIRKIVEYQTVDFYTDVSGVRIGYSVIHQDPDFKKTLLLGYANSREYEHVKFEIAANTKSNNKDIWWNLSLKAVIPITGRWDFVLKRVIDHTPDRELKSAKIGVEYDAKGS